jgi:hypothetical protein
MVGTRTGTRATPASCGASAWCSGADYPRTGSNRGSGAAVRAIRTSEPPGSRAKPGVATGFRLHADGLGKHGFPLSPAQPLRVLAGRSSDRCPPKMVASHAPWPSASLSSTRQSCGFPCPGRSEVVALMAPGCCFDQSAAWRHRFSKRAMFLDQSLRPAESTHARTDLLPLPESCILPRRLLARSAYPTITTAGFAAGLGFGFLIRRDGRAMTT